MDVLDWRRARSALVATVIGLYVWAYPDSVDG